MQSVQNIFPLRRLTLFSMGLLILVSLTQSYLAITNAWKTAQLRQENAGLRRENAVYRSLFDAQRNGTLTAKQSVQVVDTLQRTGFASERDVIVLQPGK